MGNYDWRDQIIIKHQVAARLKGSECCVKCLRLFEEKDVLQVYAFRGDPNPLNFSVNPPENFSAEVEMIKVCKMCNYSRIDIQYTQNITRQLSPKMETAHVIRKTVSIEPSPERFGENC